jgi:hypothetical protein
MCVEISEFEGDAAAANLGVSVIVGVPIEINFTLYFKIMKPHICKKTHKSYKEKYKHNKNSPFYNHCNLPICLAIICEMFLDDIFKFITVCITLSTACRSTATPLPRR